MIKAIPMEDWLRGCVHHDGRHGYVTLPCDEVLKIADFIEKLRADRKTNNSEKPNNCEDEPTWEQVKEYCNKRCLDIVDSALRKQWYKDEPQTETKTETQNSNLTFEKRTMRDCYNCERYETEDECVECHYEPKDECAKEYEELGLKELKELIEADRKTEPQTERSACDTCQWYNSGIPCGVEPSVCKREVKDEPQTEREDE